MVPVPGGRAWRVPERTALTVNHILSDRQAQLERWHHARNHADHSES